MKKQYYAVRKGYEPGIYRTWDDCKVQVQGFAGALYKGFATREEAEAFLNGTSAPAAKKASLPGESAPDAPIPPGTVVIYADGACSGNPGPGGYGTVVLFGTTRKELSGGFRKTTNNRMEILGVIAGLETLAERSVVTIYSDSKYVVDAITKSWAVKWRSNGWKRKVDNGEWADALNADLWARMLDLCDFHKVTFQWVRGHSGNKENERCDVLAVAAAAAADKGIDREYERIGSFR
jgi:ribonuclease HI